MGRQYAKNPKYFCKGCHKSFKTKRALKAHNDALHAAEPVQEHGLVSGDDNLDAGRRGDPVPDGDAARSQRDLIIIDESSPIDPKWFDKL